MSSQDQIESNDANMTSQAASPPTLQWDKITPPKGSVWEKIQRRREAQQFEPLFDLSEMENLLFPTLQNPEKLPPIDSSRSEIMISKLNMPVSDMIAAVLAMDDSVLDIDQINHLLKFYPTNEEMELLKNYTGDKSILGKCEQYFLELMKIPRLDSKLSAFLFKIQFHTQLSKFQKSFNVVNSACEEIRSSGKLHEIMQSILDLGNILNKGTEIGGAVGFNLDCLSKLSDTRAPNSNMNLMNYLCKVIASEASDLLDFHKDLKSLQSASNIQLKSLAKEMQATINGLENIKLELVASESDGAVSEVFYKTLKDFISIAEPEVATLSSLYSVVVRNADALVSYFDEDPQICPFEQVIAIFLNFIRSFNKAHEENLNKTYGMPWAAAPLPL